MKRTLIILAAAALAAGGTLAYRALRKPAPKGESYRRVQATEGPIERSLEAAGEVAPLNRVEIKPPIGGRIEELLAEEGRRVKPGQILAWLSSSDRAAVMDAARAQGPEALRRWQDAYKPTPILAPLGGTIILRNVVVGQTVDLSTVLFALSDKLIVLAHVDEVDIGRVRTGLPCRIVLDAFPDRPLAGRVVGILYEGRNVSNVITYDVKVAPEETPDFLRSQMTAVVHFILERKESAVWVPAAALRPAADGGSEVLVPGEAGRPVPRAVTTGLSNADRTEILEGLSAGDAVLVSEKPYSPQRAQASSPLVIGPRSRPGGQARGNRP